MARRCSVTHALPAECWCTNHCADPVEAGYRRLVGSARFEFRGGEALHVFVESKEGQPVSLCNLQRHTVAPAEAERLRAKLAAPPRRCEQCCRTLRSSHSNARMRRYLATVA